jgi:hypothetical protein
MDDRLSIRSARLPHPKRGTAELYLPLIARHPPNLARTALTHVVQNSL